MPENRKTLEAGSNTGSDIGRNKEVALEMIHHSVSFRVSCKRGSDKSESVKLQG